MKLAFLFILILASTCGFSEVRVASWISDGMVLQRDREVILSGKADPQESFEIVYAKKKYQIVADENGRWTVKLPAQKGDKTMDILVANRTIKDVIFGDVYLCSGQSNMELPVRRVKELFTEEIDGFSSDNIRFLTIPKEFNFAEPQDEFSTSQWLKCTPENANDFSALGYFLSKMLNEKTGVPVGIVNASWGGTPIEAWIAEEHLADFPRLIAEKKYYENDEYRASIKATESMAYREWNRVLYSQDPGKQASPQWSEITNLTDWQSVTLPDRLLESGAGSYWLCKKVSVDEKYDGKSAILRVGTLVDADSVWVNGVFVGTTSYMYPPRIYQIPEGVLKSGENIVTVRIVSNGGTPEFVAEKPYKIIFEDSEIDLTGEWFYHRGAIMPRSPEMMFFCYKPICLYNAMIAPITTMQIAGIVWYQGESNVGREDEYSKLFKILAKSWREKFGNDSPIYLVELAGFLKDDDPDGPNWMRFRDMQRRVATEVENVYLIENRDLGEWNDIHPMDKKTLAERVVNKITQKQ